LLYPLVLDRLQEFPPLLFTIPPHSLLPQVSNLCYVDIKKIFYTKGRLLMKKIIWPLLVGILLLTACQDKEPKASEVKQTSEKPVQTVEKQTDSTFPHPNLLAEDDKSYSLLVIGEQDDQSPIEDNKKINKDVENILSLPTLEMAQKLYPELHIDNKTPYTLFDNSGVILQPKNLKELTTFLQKNPPK
jgi:hypothetical protein